MKLACVIHRFGPDIAGGSEAHCRSIAEHLAAARHDVTIVTTCARDHVTWRNEYPAGLSHDGRLSVLRFPVARQRSLHRFKEISELAFSGRATVAEEEQWFVENGPEVPALIEHLRRQAPAFDRVLFWSFRYYQSYFGLPAAGTRAVLVPTAEADQVLTFGVVDRLFARPAGFVFLTPEEQSLVERHTSQPLAPSCVIGTGLAPVSSAVEGRPGRRRRAAGAAGEPYAVSPLSGADRSQQRLPDAAPALRALAGADGPSRTAGAGRAGEHADPGSRRDQVSRLRRRRHARRPADGGVGARGAVAVRKPQHRPAGSVEPRYARARQRRLRRPARPGATFRRRAVLPHLRRIRARRRASAAQPGRQPSARTERPRLRGARIPVAGGDGEAGEVPGGAYRGKHENTKTRRKCQNLSSRLRVFAVAFRAFVLSF